MAEDKPIPAPPAGPRNPPLKSGGMFAVLILGLLAGTTAGVGGYTFIYAKGASYLSDDPTSCANCHSMTAHYDAWQKSSHHAVATCNDCHTPHNFVGKYYVKAKNGWHHSVAFTLQNYHEPIQITPSNLEVTENACRHCHQDIVAQIDTHAVGQTLAAASGSEPPASLTEQISCTRCHNTVGHIE